MRYDPVENNLKYQKDTIKKPLKISGLRFCELAGTRTQDPYIKSVLLYQLSYQFINILILCN